MDHPLDNIVWNAISHNRQVAMSSDGVGVFFDDIAPFAAMQSYDDPSFGKLFDLVPNGRVVVLVTSHQINIPDVWKIMHQDDLYQMYCPNVLDQDLQYLTEIKPLDESNVSEMISLTALTKPGPFLQRTILFGQYHGIFKDRRLASMAGLRFSYDPYREISAVCTHPDFVGKGYGKAMMQYMMRYINSIHCIPFLHVRQSNTNAIRLYENLGFTVRSKMYLNVIVKR